jgi:hypothetical protein
MTNEDYSKVPPPHLLKKFSEQARVDSQKRGHAGYCKTFAKLCIDWALSSKSTSNDRQIRSSDTTPPSELVEQWRNEWIYNAPNDNDELGFLASRGAQWGADQELDACCELVPGLKGYLRENRRPKTATLKEQALEALDEEQAELSIQNYKLIRAVLESLPDHK